MNGGHTVVGIDGLIQFIVFLVVNYYIIYLIVSHSVKKGLQKEINDLKSELNELMEHLEKNKQ
ncbi:hypothetical protein MUG84_00045 [Paenibacillus sp. KQZ6P-2]|uniref:Uncharacterized protein n=1 Tax=Paenibacillus mangrovi TaxID=2931978 RepID=A0A9X1WNA1_9BACL|nr:hypothetical protein [Paenibacillus mangrovi]MCJ8010130.1 hypothetical protein [Paenibacillus mangrovi]